MLEGKSAPERFWLQLMNSTVQKKFLKMKEEQEWRCMAGNNWQEYKQCASEAQEDMDRYMLYMQFYQRKFEKCIDEGVRLANYP